MADPRPAVLLVDDRPENLVALEAVLAPLGCRMVTATSGAEALKRLLEDDFAVILLDVQMPELDGFETAAHAHGAGVIGIILTGANDDGAHGLATIKQAGGVAVIQDPLGAARRTMPDAAIAATAADAILPLEEIGKFIYGLWVQPASVREAAETR